MFVAEQEITAPSEDASGSSEEDSDEEEEREEQDSEEQSEGAEWDEDGFSACTFATPQFAEIAWNSELIFFSYALTL